MTTSTSGPKPAFVGAAVVLAAIIGFFVLPMPFLPSSASDVSKAPSSTTEPLVTSPASSTTDPESDITTTTVGPTEVMPITRPVRIGEAGDGSIEKVIVNPDDPSQLWTFYSGKKLQVDGKDVLCTTTSMKPCAITPQAAYLSTDSVTIGSGKNNVSVSEFGHYVVSGGNIYYPAITAGGLGLGCLTMETGKNCGVAELASLDDTNFGINGFVEADGKLFARLSGGSIACYDITSNGLCPGQPYAVATSTTPDAITGKADAPVTWGAISAIDGKIITVNNYVDSPSSLQVIMGCFDSEALADCAGWESPRVIGDPWPWSESALVGWPMAVNVFGSYTPEGRLSGYCTIVSHSTSKSRSVNCVSKDGQALEAPPILAGMGNPPGCCYYTTQLIYQPLEIQVDGDQRLYIPNNGNGIDDVTDPSILASTWCYSWTIGGPCEGFGNEEGQALWPDINGGNTIDTGLSPALIDGDDTCAYASGKGPFIWPVNLKTGEVGCA